MDMQALIEEIKALLTKIKSGEASQEDLEAFVAATNQLNERAIVLRYKAYEASVFGKSDRVSQPMIDQAPEAVVESIEIETTPEPTKQAEEPSFDLFGLSDDKEEAEENLMFELPEETVHTEVVVEEEAPAELPTMETYSEPEPELPIIETPVETPQVSGFSQNLHPIYEKLHQNDGTLTARLMSVHLDTLKGAFGFNERLQIIQELFGGSNEEFNHLIDSIEGISSKEEARFLVSTKANQYNWKTDSQLALELIQKIERKYA